MESTKWQHSNWLMSRTKMRMAKKLTPKSPPSLSRKLVAKNGNHRRRKIKARKKRKSTSVKVDGCARSSGRRGKPSFGAKKRLETAPWPRRRQPKKKKQTSLNPSKPI